jgi:hypothetical protein
LSYLGRFNNDWWSAVCNPRIKLHPQPFRSVVNEDGNKTKWVAFWKYFTKTWLQRYDVGLWNVNAQMAHGIDIVNRTNNPLEKYNRDFADCFNTVHPNLLTFIQVAKSNASSYVWLINNIRLGVEEAPAHASNSVVIIPPAYLSFLETLT